MPRARAFFLTAALSVGVAPAMSLLNAPAPTAAHASVPAITTTTCPAAPVAEPAVLVLPPTTSTTPTTAAARPKPKPVGDSKTDKNKPDTRAKPPAAGLPLGSPFVGKYDGADIEGYARYEGQSTCDPTAKPGTLALRDLLLARYGSTNSLGITRGCDVGGQSEHKEGRAFDWGADVTNAADVAAVNDFLNALFATDAGGHKHALARRMGVMYVIWNHQIWGAYEADAGWRPYDGENPHTNHVHISLSWAGARSETSFWSGHVVAGLPDGTHANHHPTTTTVVGGPTTTWRHHHDWPTTTTTVDTSTSTSTTSTPTTTTTSL